MILFHFFKAFFGPFFCPDTNSVSASRRILDNSFGETVIGSAEATSASNAQYNRNLNSCIVWCGGGGGGGGGGARLYLIYNLFNLQADFTWLKTRRTVLVSLIFSPAAGPRFRNSNLNRCVGVVHNAVQPTTAHNERLRAPQTCSKNMPGNFPGRTSQVRHSIVHSFGPGFRVASSRENDQQIVSTKKLGPKQRQH